MDSMDIHQIIDLLSQRRKIFHSESDFQHELAWTIHQVHPNAEIRLEKPHIIADSRKYIDLVVTIKPYTYFIELKYKTSKTVVNHNDELFELKQQGAKDQGSYDFLKDIQRIEQSSHNNKFYKGFAILLSNDPKYWNRNPRKNGIDRQFWLIPNRTLEGRLSWEAHAGKGSITNREDPIELLNQYRVNWISYSNLGSFEEFKYLVAEIT